MNMMPYAKLSVAAVMIGLIAILLLGRMAELEPGLRQLREDAFALAPRHSVLSDANLPDALTALQLHHRLIAAEWEQSKLTVDLAIAPDSRDAAALWQDLAELLLASFREYDNVQQLLFRVYLIEGGVRTLCFYGDPRKADWPDATQSSIFAAAAEGVADEQFLKRIRLSATPAGKRWLSKGLANS